MLSSLKIATVITKSIQIYIYSHSFIVTVAKYSLSSSQIL